MKLVKDLAGVIAKPGDPPYRMGQITSISGLNDSPATVTIGQGTASYEVQVSGRIQEYAPGDTVVWVQINGAPMVISRVPLVGSERDFNSPAFEPWHEVGAAGEPAFANSWVWWGAPYNTPGFWRQSDGWVHLKGIVKNGSAANTNMFTLPAGFRPPQDMRFTVISNGTTANLYVTGNGSVSCIAGGNTAYVTLDNVMFPTGWNQDQWLVPRYDTGISTNDALVAGEMMIYVRDDGLVYFQGINNIANAAPTAYAGIEVPEFARRYLEQEMMNPYGGGAVQVRLRVGGGTAGFIVYDKVSASSTVMMGGMTYHGQWNHHNVLEWINLSYATGWSFFGPPWVIGRYRKDHHGVVHLQGVVTRSGGTGLIATLPTGYRPAATAIFNTMQTGDVQCRVDIANDGTITSQNTAGNGFVNLSGIHFRAMQ